MTVEIIGVNQIVDANEYSPIRGVLDPAFLLETARVHEEAGYDAMLIGQNAVWPDGMAIATHMASVTERLQFMIAHRPGFMAPTLAARALATIDQLSQGRVRVHIITASSNIETQSDGDFLTKEERYERAHEYVGVMRKTWESAAPFDHDGPYYHMRSAFAEVKPHRQAIPISWAGTTPVGVALGASCADVYTMGPDSLASTAAFMAQVRELAEHAGRTPEFLLSVKVIVADTEEEAWARAADIRAKFVAAMDGGSSIGREKHDDKAIADMMRAAQEQGEMVDDRLWRGIALAVKGRTAAVALVGSTEQVVAALMRYRALGIGKFILSGFESLADVRILGRSVIPMFRMAARETDHALSPL